MHQFIENSSISNVAYGLLAIVFLLIIWQDFRKFEVSFWLFPAGFVLFSLLSIANLGFSDYLVQLLVNGLFVLLLIGTVWLYFFLKYRKPVKIADKYLGWGDILFFIIIAPAFDIIHFVMFLTLSFGAGILYAVFQYFRTRTFQKIPLAGIMSVILFVFEVYCLTTKGTK